MPCAFYFKFLFEGCSDCIVEMRFYKPMLYSAVAIIYASLGFRIFRLAYISHQLGKQRKMQDA